MKERVEEERKGYGDRNFNREAGLLLVHLAIVEEEFKRTLIKAKYLVQLHTTMSLEIVMV